MASFNTTIRPTTTSLDPADYNCPYSLDTAIAAMRLTPCAHIADQVSTEYVFGPMRDKQCANANERCPLCREQVTAYHPDEKVRTLACQVFEGEKSSEEKRLVEAYAALAKEALAAFRSTWQPTSMVDYDRACRAMVGYYQTCREWLKPHHALISAYHTYRQKHSGATIAKYRERLCIDLKAKIDQIANDPSSAPLVLETLRSKESLSLAYLKRLYYNGDRHALHRYFSYQPYPIEEVQGQVEMFVKDVVQDFHAGAPHSFETMSQLLRNFKVGYNLIKALPPFNATAPALAHLVELAALGVEDAQIALADVFSNGTIGSDETTEQLVMTYQERLHGLLLLAKDGSARASYHLGWAYYHNILGIMDDRRGLFSEQDRKEGFDQLFADPKIPLSYYQLVVLATGAIGDKIAYPLPLAERQQKLMECARNYDREALNILYKAYTGNTRGKENAIETPKTLEERLAKMQELKSYDETGLYGHFLAEAYLNNRLGCGKDALPLNLSRNEQIAKMELLADESEQALEELTELYTIYGYNEEGCNKFGEKKEDNLSIILALAERGSNQAMEYIARDIASAWQSLYPHFIGASPSDNEKWARLFKYAKMGNQTAADTLVSKFQAIDPAASKALEKLFTLLAFARCTDESDVT